MIGFFSNVSNDLRDGYAALCTVACVNRYWISSGLPLGRLLQVPVSERPSWPWIKLSRLHFRGEAYAAITGGSCQIALQYLSNLNHEVEIRPNSVCLQHFSF
jgi:hypothetical protein